MRLDFLYAFSLSRSAFFPIGYFAKLYAGQKMTSSSISSGGDDHPEVSHKFGDVEQ